MDILNNLNVVIGVIVGLISIGGSIVGGIAYLRHKVASSQQPTIQLQSSQRNLPQTVPTSLSELDWKDWMWVLWCGLEDCFHAKKGWGWFNAGLIGLFGGAIAFSISLLVGILFIILFTASLILFYVYFVGRRVDEKVEEKNQTLTNKSGNTQTY